MATSDFPPVPATLDDLVVALRKEMGPNGLDELDDKGLARVRYLMESYKSNPADYEKYAHFDPYKYTRNLVDDGNGKFNLLVLAWSESQMTAVHDHAGSHCLMKMLDGQLCETQYTVPEQEGQPLDVSQSNTYSKDQVAYINDQIGLHRIENKSNVERALSLHLYTPPYSECRTYNEKSGAARASGKMTFYTIRGEKVNYSE